MVNKFEHAIIVSLLTFGMITSNVAAKTADSLQSSTKLQDHVIPRNSQYSEAIIQNDTFIEKGDSTRD